MTTKWADLSLSTTGYSGTEDEPYGWDELVAYVPGAGGGDVVKIRGNRDNQGATVLFEPPAGLTFEAWDLQRYGPWGIRTTLDISMDLTAYSGGVLACRDWYCRGNLANMHISCSRRVAVPTVSGNWRGVTVTADRVDWIAASGTCSLSMIDCVVGTDSTGDVPLLVTASTVARHSVFRCSNSKGAWYDAASDGYAAATWDVDATCVFGTVVPDIVWQSILSRARYCLPWPVRESGIVASGTYTGYDVGLWGEPRAHVGGYVSGDPYHYEVLRQVMPRLWGGYDLGEGWNKLLWVTGLMFDVADNVVRSVENEMFADQALLTLVDWERVLGIVPASSATIPERRRLVVAKIRATGGLTKPYFEQLAKGLDYAIGAGTKYLTITEDAYAGFRIGYSQIGIDAIYDQGAGASMYTWRVTGTGVESDTDLQSLFNALKPAGTDIVFENV